MKLDKEQKLFFGYKVDSKLREALYHCTPGNRRYFEEAAADIAAAWGGPQALAGPFLVVPETGHVAPAGESDDSGGRARHQERVLTPRTLEVAVEVDHQMRRRGIYEVPVYVAVVTFSGTFQVPEPGPGVRRLWAVHQARLAFYESGTLPGGCFFANANFEYNARPGVIRDRRDGRR